MTYYVKCGKNFLKAQCFAPTVELLLVLQQHWIKRIIAIVIDSIIVGVATTIAFVAVFFPLFLANPTGFSTG